MCFCDIDKKRSLLERFLAIDVLCVDCRKKLNPKIRIKIINEISIEYLYTYEKDFKEYLRQYKELNDIVLFQVFLNKIKNKLQRKYKQYVIVPIPSSDMANERRGFKHVNLIFSVLEMPIHDCLEKKVSQQQKQLTKSKRREIEFVGFNLESLYNKKVLLVDDVATTGSSIISAYNLLAKYCSCIEVLVLSIVEERE